MSGIRYIGNETHKQCSKCGMVKELEEFPLRAKTESFATPAGARRAECKVCRSEYMGNYVSPEPEEQKRARKASEKLRARYGVTPGWVDRQLEKQHNQCAICQRQFGNTKLNRACVDHNHKTSKVRELLCSQCNLLIAHARENKKILDRAADYLDRHQ